LYTDWASYGVHSAMSTVGTTVIEVRHACALFIYDDAWWCSCCGWVVSTLHNTGSSPVYSVGTGYIARIMFATRCLCLYAGTPTVICISLLLEKVSTYTLSRPQSARHPCMLKAAISRTDAPAASPYCTSMTVLAPCSVTVGIVLVTPRFVAFGWAVLALPQLSL